MTDLPAFLQYGALGVLVIVLVGVFFLSIRVLTAFSRNTEVLAQTNEIIRSFKESLGKSIDTSNELMVEVKDLLLARPCMKDRKD